MFTSGKKIEYHNTFKNVHFILFRNKNSFMWMYTWKTQKSYLYIFLVDKMYKELSKVTFIFQYVPQNNIRSVFALIVNYFLYPIMKTCYGSNLCNTKKKRIKKWFLPFWNAQITYFRALKSTVHVSRNSY